MNSWARATVVFLAAVVAFGILVGAVLAFDGDGHGHMNGAHHPMGMMGGPHDMSSEAMIAMMRGVLDEESLNQMLALMEQHAADCQAGACPVESMHSTMHSMMGAGSMPGTMQGHHR